LKISGECGRLFASEASNPPSSIAVIISEGDKSPFSNDIIAEFVGRDMEIFPIPGRELRFLVIELTQDYALDERTNHASHSNDINLNFHLVILY
jgi:hypothetical protein